MFTGLITDVGEVVELERAGGTVRLRIATHYPVAELALGASIACGGPCLTVVAADEGPDGRDWFEVEATAETAARTTLGDWKIGTLINLERSLKAGGELGGHIVSGHVDGIAKILTITQDGASQRFLFEAPEHLSRYIAPKGSVALDGTSLTVNEVSEARFGVNLIPHSLTVTTWGAKRPGDVVNLEVDVFARYVARLMEFRI